MKSNKKFLSLFMSVVILNLISKICERYISHQIYRYLSLIFLIVFLILLLRLINEGFKYLDKRNEK